MNKNSKFLTLILTSAIASASQREGNSASENQQAERQVPDGYNVSGGLGGLGRSVFAHIIAGMRNGNDVREFLSTNRATSETQQDELFPWATSRAVIQAASDFINNPNNQTGERKETFSNYIKAHLADNVNVRDDQGKTALHLAAQYNLPDLAQHLIKQGANLFENDNKENTPLSLAVDSGNEDVGALLYRELIDRVRNGTISADLIDLPDREGFTLLHYAIYFENFDGVKTLVENGANILALDREKYTPLTQAFYNNNKKILSYLLKQLKNPNQITSGNVNLQDCMGWTPLNYVVMMQMLLKKGKETLGGQLAKIQKNASRLKDSTEKEEAEKKKEAKKAEIKEVEDEITEFESIKTTLEAKGANKEAKDILGLTPYDQYVPDPKKVNEAIRKEDLMSVMCHIARGADVNKKDDYGWTPLYIASANGHLSIVECLINYGANVNQGNNNGRTPLYIASENGHLSIVEFLLNHGADVNEVDGSGRTPLHIASWREDQYLAENLVKRGAKVDQPDNDGFTPLHEACYYGDLFIVTYLIDNRADINKVSNDGWTPLHVASKNGQTRIVEYLISQEADVNKVDNDGRTPLDFADDAYIQKILRSKGAKTGEELRAEQTQQ